jgi:hypothetical protein
MMRRKTVLEMSKRELLEEELVELNPEALFADGFDDAIIGYSRRINLDYVVCYSYDTCIEILMGRDEMTEEDAIEYMEYNVVGAYVGDNTPIFVQKIELL